MNWIEKENEIRSHYGFTRRKRIYDMNDKTMTFKIHFIEEMIELPYPLNIQRQIKLKKLFNEKN